MNTVTFLACLGMVLLLSGGGVMAEEKRFSEHQGTIDNHAQSADTDFNQSQCQLGRMQSPIDIVKTQKAYGQLAFKYQSTTLSDIDNSHNIQVNCQPGNQAILDDEVYQLVQFHFHTPSEHTIRGQPADMELHLVHRHTQSGGLMVVGVMMKQGRFNPVIEAVWLASQDEQASTAINLLKMLPKNKSYYTYQGSLTTPPCSEGARWVLMRQPIRLSNQQIAFFSARHPNSNRAIQPTYERVIKLITNKS